MRRQHHAAAVNSRIAARADLPRAAWSSCRAAGSRLMNALHPPHMHSTERTQQGPFHAATGPPASLSGGAGADLKYAARSALRFFTSATSCAEALQRPMVTNKAHSEQQRLSAYKCNSNKALERVK